MPALRTAHSPICWAFPFWSAYLLGSIDIDGDWYPVGSQIAQWISLFQKDAKSIPKAFTSAAFLANQEFISSQRGKWSITRDLGADMDPPSISPAGTIVVSI
jgi:hypothetical protein